MITKFSEYNKPLVFDKNIFSFKTKYNGFTIYKNKTKGPGEDGLYFIPNILHIKFGNQITKGAETVSIIQSKEFIDRWKQFNIDHKNAEETIEK